MVAREDLVLRFLLRAGRASSDAARLGAMLQSALAEARRAWPTLELPDEEFVDSLAARLRPDEDATALLLQVKVADLYLACAVARGCPNAVMAFEDSIIRRVGQFVGGIDNAPAFVSDVAQALRIKLLVGANGQGKLAQYSGRGALASWACAVAVRIAHDLRRSRGREWEADDQGLDVLAASDDPELELLRQRYRDEFRAAFAQAIADLPAQSRTLLRLYFIEQLAAAQIGLLYRVHETTVLRRIERARETVIERVRASLSKALRLSIDEFDDLVALMRSQFDVSVSRLLESDTRNAGRAVPS